MDFVEYRVEEDAEGREYGGSGAQYEHTDEYTDSEHAAGSSGTTHYVGVQAPGPSGSNNFGDGGDEL